MLSVCVFSTAEAQDNSAMWNAAKRVKLGLDQAVPFSPVITGESATMNPDSPPNTPDVQVFNPSNFWQSENSIGVNFSNANQLMVSTNGRIPGSNPVVHQPWAFSTDGGATWPSSLQSEDIPPGIVDCFGDPVAFFDVSGRAYYSTLGSPGGIYFVSTTNFGATWSTRSNADNLNSTNDDKQHAAADYSGTFPNNIYTAWTDFGVTGTPVQFARSTNQGTTWEPRVALPIGSNRGQGAHIMIGPNGEVYVTWAHYTTGTAEVGIGMAKSTDGGATFNTPAIAFPINGIRISNGAIAALNGTRASSFPYADVDRSNGPRRGWVYVVTPELVSGQSDIFIRRSTDGGTTWSSGIQVNGPDVEPGKWQFMASIAVDPTSGGISLSYYSMDSTGSNFMTNRYMAYSNDGGDTWDNFVISDVRALWAPQGTPSTNTTYNGDYYETAAMNGKAWACWTDRRLGTSGTNNRAYVQVVQYTENFGWVRGTVTNLNGGAPLANANIDFVEFVQQQGGNSSGSGAYLVGAQVDTPGTTANLTLRARKFGFLDTLLAVTVTRFDTLDVDFAMTPLDLVVTKSDIAFPATPVPGMTMDSLVARNQGTSALNLSSLTTTNPDFAVAPGNAMIPPGDSVTIRITYTPTAEGSDTGRVIILSNSVYTPRKDVILDGTAIGVPVFTASTDSISRVVPGGVRDTVSFYMRNEGTTAGDFTARAIMFPRTTANRAAGRSIVIPVTIERAPTKQKSNSSPVYHPEDEYANYSAAKVLVPKNVQSQEAQLLDASGSSVIQQLPELLYYNFNENGGTTTANYANPGVGDNPATVVGQTLTGVGQFGSALLGNGGPSSTNNVTTNWATNLATGAWTISCWLNNLPSSSTLYYLFGDAGASSFRCFIGGVAGTTGIALRGGGGPDLYVDGVTAGPTVVTYTYDPALSSDQLKAYFNGVQVGQATTTAYNINGTGFLVGGEGASSSLPSGGVMDEFRMYNRALDAFEVASTWNIELGGGVWFSVEPTQGTIAIADSVLMMAYLDATDPTVYGDPGEYLGRLDVIATNSPLADTLRIPARMFVEPSDTGVLVVDPESIDFGNVPINADSTLSFTVRNIGAQTVNVTNINITNSNFSANPTSFTLGSLGTQVVDVTFSSTSPPSTQTGNLSFVSNAASAQTVSLTGNSIGVPDFRTNIDSLVQNIEGGTRDSILFYVRNDGTGSGDFNATAVMFLQRPNTPGGSQVSVPVRIAPARSSLQSSPVVSDASSEGYDPTPISFVSTGASATAADPQFYNFNTGGSANTFPFNVTAGKRIQWLYLPGDFGQPTPAPQGLITTLYFRIATVGSGTFTNVSILLGQTTLTDLPAGDWYAGPLQPVYSRASLDLSVATVGEWVSLPLDVPFAYDPSQSLVVDITQCARVGTGLSTFHTTTSGVKRNASLVGGSCPLPFANPSAILAHCGIDVSGGTWFSVDPTAGTVAIGDSVLMKAYFDATDPAVYNNPGNYFGQLRVAATNSDLADTLQIPVRMFVVPPPGPRMTVDVDSIDFGDVEIDSTRTLPLVVRNIGAAALTVTGINMSDTSFSAIPMSFTLASLETLNVNVTFTAPSPGSTRLGTMQFVSNDPSAPSVALRGRSVGVAHVVVQPDSFFFSTTFGDSVDGTLAIRNTGLGELMYTSLVSGGFVGQDSVAIGSATTSLATSSALMKGGVVQVTSSIQLNEIKSWLNITASRELRFIVYENTTGTSFTKIFEVAVNSGTGGPQWYSSGPVNVQLEAGKTYGIGVNWPAITGLTYHYQSSAPVPVPIPFGMITGGLSQSGFPPAATITQGSLSTLYYTQLVTSSSQWLNILSGGAGTIASGDTALLGFRAYSGLLTPGNFQAAIKVQSNDPMAPTVSVPVVVDILTGVGLSGSLIPDTYELYQNYPNPFNPTTQIRFGLPVQSLVTVRIYNVLGQEVARLISDVKAAGYYTMRWNGTNQSGAQISSGVYFYSLDAQAVDGGNTFRSIKKMLMLK